MKQGTANLAEDYRFIHKALRPVGTAANCRDAAVKFEACTGMPVLAQVFADVQELIFK